MKRLIWLLTATLAVPARGESSTVDVNVVLKDEIGPPVEAVLYATAVTTESDSSRKDESAEPKAFPVTIPGKVRLSLPEAVAWRLELESDRYWSPATMVTFGTEVPTLIKLRPTGLVTGKLTSPRAEDLEGALLLRFIASEFRHEDSLGARGYAKCPIEDGKWHCRVPVGVFDLHLRSRGYVSHFFWDRQVEHSAPVNLGEVSFVRGSSLVGFARTEDNSPLSRQAKVSLVPRSDTPVPAKVRVRGMEKSVSFNSHGFFQFEGVASGSYVLTASHPGFADTVVDSVVVHSEKESRLHEALVFHRPVEATFLISPPVDVSGESWRLELWKLKPVRTRIRSGIADPAGNWLQEGLEPGKYDLAVADSRGERVAHESVEIDMGSPMIHLEIPIVWVEGDVTLGDEPLSANLMFGGSSGIVSVRLASDEEGKFAGYLPRQGEWDVDVRSHRPSIFRRLRKVEVEADTSGVASVHLRLPDTLLEVEVVDEEGRALGGASIMLMQYPTLEKPSFGKTNRKGKYTLRGLEYSEFRVEAHFRAPDVKMRAEPVVTHLSKQSPSSEVRLVARQMKKIRGRVVSTYGTGVPGARLWFRPAAAGGIRGLVVPEARTDTNGEFEVDLLLDPGPSSVRVLAPGFTLRTLELAVDPGRPSVITVDQDNGGTLTVELGENDGQTFLEVPRATIVHDGKHRYDLGILNTWARMNGWDEQQTGTISVPLMPAGVYKVCWSAGSPNHENTRRCREGFLAPQGSLELTLEAGMDKDAPGQ